MWYKELGRTGTRIPEIGIGTWNYRAGPAALRRALEDAARFIDTAESYGTEEVVGKAIAGIRDSVFVATKVSPAHFRAADLRKSVEGSLQRLGIERIDLLQLHAPNPAVPLSETLGTLDDLTTEGKIRFIGVSNFSLRDLQEAQRAGARHGIVSNQLRYSLIDRSIEDGLLGYCQASGVTVIAYSPLAREFSRVRDCDPSGVLERLATETGRTPAQILLNWCISKVGVVAIPKSNSPAHMRDNCGASGWRLTPEHIRILDTGIEHRRRNRFDTLVRQFMPATFRVYAVSAARHLPRSLRRRLT